LAAFRKGRKRDDLKAKGKLKDNWPFQKKGGKKITRKPK
jgi:hypothetical protein